MRTKPIMLGMAAVAASALAASPAALGGSEKQRFPVSGSGVDLLDSAIVHSQQPTANGMTQRATETVRLSGDLRGYVLYHVTSEFDFVGRKLVNTGTQWFSGTVRGSAPIVLFDDRFRFEVDLATGEESGEVHLSRSKDSPETFWYGCDLDVVGTGYTPEGNPKFDYTGECTREGH